MILGNYGFIILS